MKTPELQYVVLLEASIVLMITTVIVSAFNRWKTMLYLSSSIAAIALFSAWTFVMALGAVMVYGPASVLLWHELDRQTESNTETKGKFVHTLSWILLGLGVLMLILKNMYNIYGYLN
jgi:hypothetical protein